MAELRTCVKVAGGDRRADEHVRLKGGSSVGHVLFHLAFPIPELKEAKRFHGDRLWCELGRTSASAMILNLRAINSLAVTTHPGERRRASTLDTTGVGSYVVSYIDFW